MTGEEKAKQEQRCLCGLHVIRAGVNGVHWYWALHTRERCSLDLPNERCWCGRLRSEHQDEHGHEPGARDARVLADLAALKPER
jgi:hypothetical protein